MKKVIQADRFDDVWDQVKDINQEFSSADTSINSKKLPAVYNLINIPEGSVVLDYGGGRFTNVCDYYSQYNIVVLIFDPFNQSSEHNQEVIQKLRDIGGADIAVCSNVLNVIKEPSNRLQVLENIKKLIKPGAPVYITVYEGKGNGEEGPTKSGYQLNKKTKDYLEEIQEVFPEAKRKGKLIMASKNIRKSSISASVTYPNGKPVSDIDLNTYLDYMYGTDRDKDNSKYTEAEKQRATNYWFKKHGSTSHTEIESASDTHSDRGVYFDHQVYTYRGQKYMVYFTKSDDALLPGYKAIQITEVHPYDDAEYAWIRYNATEDSNYAYIIKHNRKADRIAISTWGNSEDYYESIDDFRDDVIDGLIDELRDENEDVEPRMIHNSTKIKGRSIRASKKSHRTSRRSIMAAEDDEFDMDDFGDTDDSDENLEDTNDDEDVAPEVPEVSPTDIDNDNNITDHYVAECESCHGIFISSLKESEQPIHSITGTCPLCNKNTTQDLLWIVRENDAPDTDDSTEVF